MHNVVLCLLVLLLSATGAQAVSVSSVSLTDNSSGVWGDGINPEPDCVSVVPFCPTGLLFDDPSSVVAPNGWNGWNSDGNQSGTVGGGGSTFSGTHEYYLASQAQNAISTALDYDPSVTVSIAVTAINPLEEWSLTIDVSNVGTVGHTDANAGIFEIADSTSFLTITNPDRTNESSTGVAFFDTNDSFGSNATFNDAGGSFNQSGSFVVTGTGSQTISFDLDFTIDSDITGMLSFGSGDSMCVNGGLGGSPNVACSVGGGTGLSIDGSIVQTLVPEPNTALLVGGGLMVIGAMRRRG